ncbi:MAG: hypothetical protein ACP5PW_04200, partial [Candidatus Dormibacteria bacterium]
MSFPHDFGRRNSLRVPTTLGLLALLAAAAAAGTAAPALAATATLVVNGQAGSDTGNCVSAPCSTLQYALDQAATGDTIEIEGAVKASDSATFGGAVIPTSISTLSIVGVGGAYPPQLSGGLTAGEMGSTVTVQSGETVAISNLEIADGVAQKGGGIYNTGNLTLDNVVVNSNSAAPITLICSQVTKYCQGLGAGGGIYNEGSLTLWRSAVVGNVVGNSFITSAPPAGGEVYLDGGGIYNLGSLAIYDSSVAENSAAPSSSPVPQSAAGGGIFNLAEGVQVVASTIYKNFATVGAGIFQESGIGVPTMDLGASLVVENAASSGGLSSECAAGPGVPPPTSLGYNAADSEAAPGCGLSQPTDGVSSSPQVDNGLSRYAYGLL